MNRIATILFLFCVFVVSGMAQNAETILDNAANIYGQSNGISVQFSINIQAEKQGFAESFEGTIQMRGDKFVLVTPDMRNWYDGTTLWTLFIDEVSLTTPSGDDLQLINPMYLFRTYKTGFNYSYTGESTADSGKSAYDVQLTSKGRGDIEKIEVQIEKTSSLPARMTVYMKNGIRSLIRISKMQTDLNLPDSFFVFNPKDYPDVMEIDLR